MDKLREAAQQVASFDVSEYGIVFQEAVKRLRDALRQQTPAVGEPRFETIDGEQQTHAMVVRNLSMLVRRLIHRIHSKYKAPDDAVAKQAWDYLMGEGLQGSVLRAALTRGEVSHEQR